MGGTMEQSTDQEVSEKLTQLKSMHGSKRLLLMMNLIGRAYKAAEQVPPTGDALIDRLETWAETLEPIITARVEAYYLVALHAKDNKFVVSAQDILVAFNRDMSEDEDEANKILGWERLTSSDGNVRMIRPMTPCEYPGCEEPCYSRYCMTHGDLHKPYRLNELKPEFRQDTEAHE